MNVINSQKGFTVVELMVVMVVALIILTVGVPAYSSMIHKNRLSTTVNDFSVFLQISRSYAIQANRSVTISPVDPAADDEWGKGAVARNSDNSEIARFDTDGLLKIDSLNKNISSIKINSRGYLSSAFDDVLTICSESDETLKGRQIAINIVGRLQKSDFDC